MASDTTDPFDRAAEDRFRGELIAAGFEVIEPPRRWAGPLPDGLAAFDAATHLEVRIVDGFPVNPPKVYAPGATLAHVAWTDEVCLWRPDDRSGAWITVDGVLARLREFNARALAGFADEDLMLDAHLSFRWPSLTMAVMAVEPLAIEESVGTEPDPVPLRGLIKGKVLHVEQGKPDGEHPIEGRAYRLRRTTRDPPRDLVAVEDALGKRHRKNFDRLLVRVRADGLQRLAVFTWPTNGGPNVLAVLLDKRNDDVVARAMEVAPTDQAYLAQRSGPDHEALRDERVVMFGVGAIGSHVARALATSGVADLTLIDPDRVRPGNVPRLASGFGGVGYDKVVVAAVDIQGAAPWAKVTSVDTAPRGPKALRAAIAGADLVVDATGSEQVARSVENVASELIVPLVTAALYRGGALARVRRVRPGADVALDDRGEADGYPLIPPGTEPQALEPGCASPVNNASPVACLAAAALAADVCVDTLVDSGRYPDEVIDVYRPIEAPFDVVGRHGR